MSETQHTRRTTSTRPSKKHHAASAKPEATNRRPRGTKVKPPAAASVAGAREDYAARNARIAATLDLTDLRDAERAFLATCQKIARRHTGDNSPFEHFFYTLVHWVELERWPMPGDVAAELEIFRRNFEDMRANAATFLATRSERRPGASFQRWPQYFLRHPGVRDADPV
jgi:hypothetical protein